VFQGLWALRSFDRARYQREISLRYPSIRSEKLSENFVHQIDKSLANVVFLLLRERRPDLRNEAVYFEQSFEHVTLPVVLVSDPSASARALEA
jgi:hypothetical protein